MYVKRRDENGRLKPLESVFGDKKTQEERIKGLEEENLNLMLSITNIYEEQSNENLNLMMAISELYELLHN